MVLPFLLFRNGSRWKHAVIFWTNMANFPSEQHGRIVGIINGVGFIGSMLFNVIYTRALSPNLAGYFAMICVMTGITFTLGILFNTKVEDLSMYEPIEFMKVKEDPRGKIELSGVDHLVKPFWKSIHPFNLFILSGISFGVVNAQLVWLSSQVESLHFTNYMALILSIVIVPRHLPYIVVTSTDMTASCKSCRVENKSINILL